MNVITKLGSNFAGLLSPTREKRNAAAESVSSLARANILGRLSKMQAAAAKSATTGAQSTAATKASTAGDSESTKAESSSMDRDAFLELLVTQMQYQDPMDPVDNSEMMAQLAQFSALEQMTDLNDTMEFVSGNIDQLNFISASSMVGQTVAGVNLDGESVKGVVDNVYMDDSIVYLNVGDEIMSMAGVVSIGESS